MGVAYLVVAMIAITLGGAVGNYWAGQGGRPAVVPEAPLPLRVLSWPLPGAVVTQGFGPSPYNIEPAFGGYPHFHTGLDLQGPAGSLILASAGGLVMSVTLSTVSGPGSGYGTYVVINHGHGLTTLYAHLAGVFVYQGQLVTMGQAIGTQGSTGNSTGPHLHVEVRVNGTPVDPSRCFPLPPAAFLYRPVQSSGGGSGPSGLQG